MAVTVSEPSLASTAYAFALVRADGSVVTWGDPDAGADSQDVQAELKDVAEVYGTCFAFAALLIDGRVITWGYPESGGDSSALNLTNVQRIVSSTSSFAALKVLPSWISFSRVWQTFLLDILYCKNVVFSVFFPILPFINLCAFYGAFLLWIKMKFAFFFQQSLPILVG